MRDSLIERRLMTAELHLDGLKTHMAMNDKCALSGSVIESKVRASLTAVRSARDILRADTGQNQRTITTRGKNANRHGLWTANPRPSFSCPFDKSPEAGIIATCWLCKATFTKRKECKTCRLFICPTCGGCGCKLTPEAREAVHITLNAVFRTDYWTPMLSTPTMNEPKEPRA
jgi:hypothetical protein